ncbi:MAG: fatty-acid--CoA ligase, partial [Deltaproteobacteria bacterium]|nr:fatty-acid--CoA ligase [Deltaproteobacteria bacterium]MBW2650919.1 fatty-acid--CoA ligase [Deltaproteobacteria bacterium]
IGVPHPEWGETVVAMIVPAKDKNLNEDILKSFLGDKLAGYKIPRTIKFVDELPHTPSGKVMKYKLREEYK